MFDHIGLKVKNFEASVRFYRDALELVDEHVVRHQRQPAFAIAGLHTPPRGMRRRQCRCRGDRLVRHQRSASV